LGFLHLLSAAREIETRGAFDGNNRDRKMGAVVVELVGDDVVQGLLWDCVDCIACPQKDGASQAAAAVSHSLLDP
jgi:hypothetical protein